MDTIEIYSVLMTSKIEGIEVLASKLNNSILQTKKKPYDILDFRFELLLDQFFDK